MLRYKKAFFGKFGRLVADECFPAGTPVDTPNGPVAIEMLKVGDLVNTSSGPLPISNTFAKLSDKLLRIKLESGETIECTENHPFATTSGWVEAWSIGGMSVVRLDVHQHNKQRSTLLQSILRKKSNVGIQNTRGSSKDRTKIGNETKRATELEQRCSLPTRNTNKDQSNLEKTRSQTTDSRWKWPRCTLRSNDGRNAVESLETSVVDTNWKKIWRRLSERIQSRFCQPEKNESVGNRRGFSRIAQTLRCEERFIAGITRVVSVTYLEHSSKRMVFNLQVNGPVAIEMLKVGDLVNTSSGPLPISNTFAKLSDKLLLIS